jgi:hypothetical protein
MASKSNSSGSSRGQSNSSSRGQSNSSSSSRSRSGSSGQSGSRGRSGSSGQRDGKVNPAQLARSARAQLAELTGRSAESVLGLQKDDENGWKVMVEVVELSRVPNSTDLLGCYVVTLDEDGELVGYERVRRYQRGQAGGNE